MMIKNISNAEFLRLSVNIEKTFSLICTQYEPANLNGGRYNVSTPLATVSDVCRLETLVTGMILGVRYPPEVG